MVLREAELNAYRLDQLEKRVADMEEMLETYQKRIMYAVIGGGLLANSPSLAHIVLTALGNP